MTAAIVALSGVSQDADGRGGDRSSFRERAESSANRQVERLQRSGVPYARLLTEVAPTISPGSQETTDRRARYAVAVLKDPARKRTVSFDFGDGTAAQIEVPQGEGAFAEELSHRFPSAFRSYVQRVSDGGRSDGAVTYVCRSVKGGRECPPPT